jgi:hypothetical protein
LARQFCVLLNSKVRPTSLREPMQIRTLRMGSSNWYWLAAAHRKDSFMTDRISAAGLDALKAAPNKTTENTATAIGYNLQSIESLRILAALLVVCAHLPPYTIPVLGQFLGANRFLGSIGVDLFFVISGVVIGLSTVRAATGTAGRPLRSFLVARIFRIFPLYWSLLVLLSLCCGIRADPCLHGKSGCFRSHLFPA